MSIVHVRAAIAIVGILIAGITAESLRTQAGEASSADWDPARAEAIPERIGDWVMVSDSPAEERELETLQRLAAVERVYAREEDGQELAIFLVYGLTMQAMHFPERCLRAGGWNMTTMHSIMLPDPDGEGSFEATLINSERGPSRRAQQVYLFADATGTSANWLSLLWREGRTGIMQDVLCMVIVVREIMPEESEAQSLAYLQHFLLDLLPHVHESLRMPDTPVTP